MITSITSYTKKHEPYLDGMLRSLDRGVIPLTLLDEPCKGQRARLNELVKRVETEWVMMMDADDFNLPMRYPIWQQTKDIASLIYTDYLHENGLYESRYMDLEVFMNTNFIPFSTICVKTEILRNMPFIPGKQGALDWVWLHMIWMEYGDFLYIPCATVYRRIDTSHFHSKIPVYRKVKRILKNRKAKRMIRELYENMLCLSE